LQSHWKGCFRYVPKRALGGRDIGWIDQHGMRTALGTNSCSSANRFALYSLEKKLIPVRLPLGRARLAQT
jgi:hypothetical protein